MIDALLSALRHAREAEASLAIHFPSLAAEQRLTAARIEATIRTMGAEHVLPGGRLAVVR